MNSSILLKIKSLAKDEASFEVLKELITDLENQKKSAFEQIDLVERAISNDYDSIIITDLQMESPGPRIVYVNDGFTRLTGFSKEEAIGKTPRILQGPKTDRKTLDRLKESLRDGKSFFGQAVNYRKDGSEFINQWDIHPLFDRNGTITHWVSYQHDITKRKAAEKTFNETEIEFDDLIEYSKRTLLDLNLSGSIIQANKSFRTLTGFENAELIGHDFTSILEDSESKTWSDLIINPKEKTKYTFTLKTKNHIPIQIEAESEFHSLDTGDLIRLNVHNVSMQKNVLKTLENRLFNSTELFSQKSEFNYELSFDSNKNPHFTYLSEGFNELTGYNSSDFFTTESWNKLFSEEDKIKASSLMERVISGIDLVEELTLHHADGTEFKVLNYAQLDITEQQHGKTRVSGSIVKVDNQD